MTRWIKRQSAAATDFLMCAAMNASQWRLRRHICSREDFEAYLKEGETLTKEKFYPLVEMEELQEHADAISWKSPRPSGFLENDRAMALIFPCGKQEAPTVIILHALMSASDRGYRRWAKKFNDQGWNVALLHLPFHYSRIPAHFFNGELAITGNLIRFGETVRQAVMEVRQLMAFFRARGCKEFGLWATSYGGWIGALTLSLEKDFCFACLMQPIVNPEHTIWKSPASGMLRRLLSGPQITAEDIARHSHLTSPIDSDPVCDPSRILIFGGTFDTLSPVSDLEKLHSRWRGSHLMIFPQGHFGYTIMNEAYRVCLPYLQDHNLPVAS